MNWLAENALPIWAVGAIALTMAVIVYLQTRTNGALVAVGVVIATTALLLLAEWLMETPREAVKRTLYRFAAAVEANDVPETLSFVSPAARRLRTDVESLMPLVRIELANVVGNPEIEIDESRRPQAMVKFQCVLQATVKRDGMKGTYADKFVVGFERAGEQWLLTDLLSTTKGYGPETEWRRVLGAKPVQR